jgi:hypothetical protein
MTIYFDEDRFIYHDWNDDKTKDDTIPIKRCIESCNNELPVSPNK